MKQAPCTMKIIEAICYLLEEGEKSDLTVEMILTALRTVRQQPEMGIKEAVIAAAHDWDV